MRFYVYTHEYASGPKAGRPFYVGKGSGRRAWSVSTRSRFWKAVSSKYGHTVRIIDDGISETQAFELEKFLIETIGQDCLCNHTGGGEGSANPSVELREKLRASHLGKRHSAESKLKLSLVGKGRKLSPEHKEALRLSRVGVITTDDVRAKISRSKMGIPCPLENRIKRGFPIKCSNGKTFASVGLAVEWLIDNGTSGAQRPPILGVCRGARKTAYGFSWEFVAK